MACLLHRYVISDDLCCGLNKLSGWLDLIIVEFWPVMSLPRLAIILLEAGLKLKCPKPCISSQLLAKPHFLDFINAEVQVHAYVKYG